MLCTALPALAAFLSLPVRLQDWTGQDMPEALMRAGTSDPVKRKVGPDVSSKAAPQVAEL